MSEAKFEQSVINQLEHNGWTYRDDLSNCSSDVLVQHWRAILNANNIKKLKGIPLSDAEFNKIMTQINSLHTPYDTQQYMLGTGGVGSIMISRNNEPLYLDIFFRDDVAGGKSIYEVVNQITFTLPQALTGHRRLDVMLLINGLPVTHLELKDDARQNQWNAFEQLKGYASDGMYTGLFNFVQVQVIMSPHSSQYFARPDTFAHYNKAFVFGWRDSEGHEVTQFDQFISQVLSIPALHRLVSLNIISDSDRHQIMVMRSYQIQATRAIMQRLQDLSKTGHDIQKGGYIWHTTGSGKTITAFKIAQLLMTRSEIHNVLFIVDRVDLVDQTYDNFSEYAYPYLQPLIQKVNRRKLVKGLRSSSSHIFIMSIQALMAAVNHHVFDANRNIIIMDEAHRSSDGKSVKAIKRAFPNSTWFGFTGTPNFYSDDEADIQTSRRISTHDIFGPRLHQYTIQDAIGDHNVLGFDVTYNDSIIDSKSTDVALIDQYDNDKFRHAVMDDIAEHWNNYASGPVINGLRKKNVFHAILATSGKNAAARYYQLFKKYHPELNVVLTYSVDENLDIGKDRDEVLKQAMLDYCHRYHKKGIFESQYPAKAYMRDIVLRLAHLKNYVELPASERIDLVIVSDQLLTGFDSKYVNMIYMDKIKREGDLIQAMSRTNRVFDFTAKPYGQIKFYRENQLMQQNVENALKIYTLGGNDTKDANGTNVSHQDLEDQHVLAKSLYSVIVAVEDKLRLLRQIAGNDFDNSVLSEKQAESFVHQGANAIKDINELLQRGYQYGQTVTDPNDSTHTIALSLPNENLFGALQAKVNNLNIKLPPESQYDLSDVDIRIHQRHEEIIDYDKLCELLNAYLQERTQERRLAVQQRAQTVGPDTVEDVSYILDQIDHGTISESTFDTSILNHYQTQAAQHRHKQIGVTWAHKHNYDVTPEQLSQAYDAYEPGQILLDNPELETIVNNINPQSGFFEREQFKTDLLNFFDSIF